MVKVSLDVLFVVMRFSKDELRGRRGSIMIGRMRVLRRQGWRSGYIVIWRSPLLWLVRCSRHRNIWRHCFKAMRVLEYLWRTVEIHGTDLVTQTGHLLPCYALCHEQLARRRENIEKKKRKKGNAHGLQKCKTSGVIVCAFLLSDVFASSNEGMHNLS